MTHFNEEGASLARVSSADRREAIIHAALRVIQREGVHGATTRAIVAEADMPLASFHYAFRSRDEMISELIAFVVENEGRAAIATLNGDRDIRSAVRAGLQAYFDTLTADPSREQAMFELLHYALRTDELSALPRAQYRMYRRTAGEVLDAGAEVAGATWRLPLDQVASLLVTFISGLTLAWLADRDDDAAALAMDFAADSIAALAEPRPGHVTAPSATTAPHSPQ
ncbi:DNA-binding transcriptional regulator YbjK [Cryobacterium mesophilum]|uniref:TetR family transcriptional regulator n=1 Tax=Terrimesophilobacter mesophilus TaxID=433647 RepID=A0A4R8VAZ0_9MICO|nr:TetR family transcriptional regulator [Terrimesophilobacter mesophilus]MBB5633759.1 DNA-binding transcriptional regulator YbjK [Terrimesophilobacter mesophilus]TFB80441.1 TetR family transcriptional regulator [Terrimesophilobacter mesophilus]